LLERRPLFSSSRDVVRCEASLFAGRVPIVSGFAHMDARHARSQPASAARTLVAPVAPGERYEIIDIVRGFALFGVLLANMVWTTQDEPLTDEQRQALVTRSIDDAAQFFTSAFINGKFYTLFSMLFGLGFAVQLTRASERGVNVLPTYIRRLGILLAFGILHGVLLWFGDILQVYALLGFVLILFAGRSNRAILRWVIALAALAFVFPALHWVGELSGWGYPVQLWPELTEAEYFNVMSGQSYAAVIGMNWSVHLHDYGKIGFQGGIYIWYFNVLWKFLLGFYIGRRMLLQEVDQHLHLFRQILPWALVIGLAGNVYTSGAEIYDPSSTQNTTLRLALECFHEVSVFALAIAYLCALVLLCRKSASRKILAHLAPLGRMALTNYLTQSACIVLLFYGIGLGLVGKVGAAGCVLFSVAIFAAQIGLSALWLKFFRFGPVEWVWRCLTYGRWQPLRQRQA
jgi:uncharacterized protein